MNTLYGFSTSLDGGLGRPDFFKATAAAGLNCVELCATPGHLDDWMDSPEETAAQAKEHGVAIPSVHSGQAGWYNNSPDEEVRRKSVQTAISCFEPAKRAGAEVVVVHPTFSDEPLTDEAFDGNWERATRSLKEMAEAAADVGILIAAENLPARGRRRPGAPMSEVLEMIGGLGDHVGVCIDAGHSNANGQDAAAEARLAADRVFAVHIADNDGQGQDQHLLPGDGTVDWKAFIAALDEIGYARGRMFEIGSGNDHFEQTLAALARLRDGWL
jgi:sugar phosphate isomerase/epimerase